MKRPLVVLGVLVAAVAIGAVGFLAGDRHGMSEGKNDGDMMKHSESSAHREAQSSVDSHVMADGAEDVTQDYLCGETTRFTANFTIQNEVAISRDSVTIVTLPKLVSASGLQFGDAQWLYAFKGQNALVTDKTAKKTVTCGVINKPGSSAMSLGNWGR